MKIIRYGTTGQSLRKPTPPPRSLSSWLAAANASYTATIAIFGILGSPSKNVLYVVMRLTLLMIAVVIVVAVEVLFFPIFPSVIVERR